jgi:hypothetical protein
VLEPKRIPIYIYIYIFIYIYTDKTTELDRRIEGKEEA